MHIRTTIVAAIASLGITGIGLGDWGPLPVNLSNELTVTDSENFGISVAIDGDICVIGAQGNNSSTGSAYVFTKSGGSWSQVTELTASGGASYDYFGSKVAIDGDTCVIGAAGTNSYAGSAYVFTRSGGSWSQVAELTASDGASYDYFGSSIAIDGDTCVIGAGGTNDYTGSAFVFTNTGGSWSQVAELTVSGGANEDQFGISVALDGDTCVIGAAGTNSSTGSAYVFTRSGGIWSQAAELTASGGASEDQFGVSAALDGDTCVIGALGTNSYAGSAYVFTRSGGIWSQAAELTDPDGFSYDQFGISVAIDGGTCVIGGTDTILGTGSAYVFTNTGGSWSQVAELTSGDNDGGFGWSVTIDGDTCAIGAPVTNDYTGSAFVFSSSSSTAATGACCVTIGCTVIAESACTDLGGTWTEGGSCDDCPASCTGDTNGDGTVDVGDLLLVIGGWGTCP